MDGVHEVEDRKRKSQDQNGESKRWRKRENDIVNIQTEKIDNIKTEKTEDKEEKSDKMLEARQLIQKLKSKKLAAKSSEESPFPTSSTLTDGQDAGGDVPGTSQVQRRLPPTHNKTKAHIVLQRCKDLLQKLKTEFTQSASLREAPKVKQWKNDLEELETKLALPETVIAVVGDTGAGKSSLMNALLEWDILPTSGMRACTAVVAEVVSNTDNDKYEADITFLSKEDWDEELRLLLSDLTDVNGKIKKGTPDPRSEAGVALLKIKAVYGKIDRFEDLEHQTNNVTSWLGRVKKISHSEPVDFRNEIEEYIMAHPGSGDQFWPIVKKVTIRLPNCDACSSGAVLVDLPGIGDANAARDRIAQDHLKNCAAVWIISSIHRAIDDKTAKDLLGENFRRQLLMDGQYGSISFICTKTDAIKNSETIRELELEDKVQPLENEINRLEKEKSELEITKRDIARCIDQLERSNLKLRGDIEEFEKFLQEEGEGESQELRKIKEALQEQQDALRKNNEQIEAYHDAVRKSEKTCLQLEMTISKKTKELSSLCAKARNDYSKKEIRRDFKAGLREMKMKAGTSGVEEMDDDLYDSDDDDDDIKNSAENLQVFCVSAMEYQKLRNIITNDGPPTVFSIEEETQIPALRSYIHQMTTVRHKKSLERNLQHAAQLVFTIENYLTEDGSLQTKGERIKVRSGIKERSQSLKQKFKSIIDRLRSEVESALSNQIKPKLEEGITAAKAGANEKAAKWSSSVNKENKQAGGMRYLTYRAVVERRGVYTSRMYGNINFNQHLAEPMYTSIGIVWDKVFSGLLWEYFEDFKDAAMNELEQFVSDLSKKLPRGIRPSSTQKLQACILVIANYQLSEMTDVLKESVTKKQRDANRVLTPIVQMKLTSTYNDCVAVVKGPGAYERMKKCLEAGIDERRLYMFDDAASTLLQSLEEMKIHVLTIVQEKCNSLCSDVQKAFEPLWEDPGTSVQLRNQLLTCVGEISQKMRTILEEANVEVPSSFSASSTDQPSSSTSL